MIRSCVGGRISKEETDCVIYSKFMFNLKYGELPVFSYGWLPHLLILFLLKQKERLGKAISVDDFF